MTIHYFESTGEAYDMCQYDDTIQTGDTLVIASEGVVGLADTWPVAITAKHGKLHVLDDGVTAADLKQGGGHGAPLFTVEQIAVAMQAAIDLAGDHFADIGDTDDEWNAAPAKAAHPHDMRGRLTTALDVLRFVRAGNATITLVSRRTEARFTYKISVSDDGNCHFVNVLSGPDNNRDYQYLGRIARDVFWIGRKVPRPGEIKRDAPSAKAFDWAWRHLVRGELPDSLEVWHEGSCGRCGRKLTVPASIASGFGPECIQHIHI